MKIINICKKHIKDNILIYILLSAAFMVGISSGAITINMISVDQKQEIIKFLESFLKLISENNVDSAMIVKQSLKNNLQSLIILWFLGITIIGIPLIVAFVVLRGFVIGFTVGFIVKQLGIKGFIFAMFSILPQNIFFIPWIIASSTCSIVFAIKLLKNKLSKNNKSNFISNTTIYTIAMSTLFLISLVGTLVESYVTPIFMKLIS